MNKEKKMNEQLEKVAEALKKRGFKAVCCATGADARDYVMNEAEGAKSVGFGGSVTVKSIGLVEELAKAGKEILRHGDPLLSPEQKVEVMHRERTCDLFLLSANARTMDGRLVNIDGNGNRVAASIYGPGKVVFVVGRNKLVDGGLDDAIARIKRCACPPNCRRLNKQTPCAVTGECADCSSPDRICMVTVVMDRRPRSTGGHVVLVDGALGY